MTSLPEFGHLQAADAAEQAHLDALAQLATLPGSTARDHYDPGHFTASALVLSPDRSQLLLIEHSKLHRWLQPGGHIEPSDVDLEAAARREAAEEVGLTDLVRVGPGPFDVDVHTIPARAEQPEHRHYDVRYLFIAPSEHVVAGSDALAARWVPLHEVRTLHTDASVLRAVRKIQQLAQRR